MYSKLRIGFACKITESGGEAVKGMNIKSLMLRSVKAESIRSIVDYNIDVLYKQFEFLFKNGISVFRLCSDIVPFGSSPHMPIDYEKEFKSKFLSLGEYAKKLNLRLSMHPGQYTVLNSPKPGVLNAAIADLNYHCTVLDMMDLPSSCKIVTHIGGGYGNREASLERFIENYELLSPGIKARLIVENDYNIYNAAHALKAADACGCPAVIDLHHNELFPSELDTDEVLGLAAKSWKPHDGRMKIHYSQSGAGKVKGAHSETIEKEGFLKMLALLKNRETDIMLEVKDKNISALNCKRWLIEAGGNKENAG